MYSPNLLRVSGGNRVVRAKPGGYCVVEGIEPLGGDTLFVPIPKCGPSRATIG